jgi:hypothetical protein
MSGVITTSSFAKSLFPGVNKWYGDKYNEWPVEWDKLFDKNTSKRAWEEDVGISGLGLLSQKAEGAGITYDATRQGFTTRYNHVVYASGFVVTREAYEDDLYDVVGKQKAQSLAFSVRQTKEILAANVYNRAFNTSYVGGDSASLVASAGGGGSTTHALVAGGTWTNGVAVAVDISEAALEQACIDIANFVSDRGLKIAVRPQTLIIPKELMFEANRILKSEGRIGTDNNDLNALKTMGLIPNVVVNHYLTDTDAWFIRTDAQDGMKYFERRGDEFTTDDDFDTENAKYKATFRCAFGWTDPRGMYGSPGA